MDLTTTKCIKMFVKKYQIFSQNMNTYCMLYFQVERRIVLLYDLLVHAHMPYLVTISNINLYFISLVDLLPKWLAPYVLDLWKLKMHQPKGIKPIPLLDPVHGSKCLFANYNMVLTAHHLIYSKSQNTPRVKMFQVSKEIWKRKMGIRKEKDRNPEYCKEDG